MRPFGSAPRSPRSRNDPQSPSCSEACLHEGSVSAFAAQTQTGATPSGRARSRGRGARNPPALLSPLRSVVVDVDVDLVGNADGRAVPARAELGSEDKQQHEHDDDQKHYGKYAAAATAPVSTTVVCSRSTSSRSSAIGNSPCSRCFDETNELRRRGFREAGEWT